MKNNDSDIQTLSGRSSLREYLCASVNDFRDLKKITLAGLMAALSAALQIVTLSLTSSLKIQITFLVSAISGAMFGPFLSLLRGAVADIVGFLLYSSDPFFFGYTLSAMLGALVYSLFLYRQKITLFRIFVSKAIVNYAVNAALGSVWNVMLLGKNTYLGYLAVSLAKNTVLLPLEVLVILLLFSSLIPVMSRYGLIKKQETFEVRAVTVVSLCALFFLIGAVLILYFVFPDTLSAIFSPIYTAVKDFFKTRLVK